MRLPCDTTIAPLAAVFLAFLIPAAFAASVSPRGLPFVVATSGPDAIGGRPAINSNGGDFIAAWRTVGGGEIDFGRIGRDGGVVAAGSIPVGSGAHVPSVGAHGSGFLLVWSQGSEVRGARLDAAGVVVGPAFTITSGGDVKDRPIGIAFDGTRYLLAWRTNGDVIRALRVDTAGNALDSTNGTVVGNGFYPWVAAGGGTFMVAWHAHGANGLEVMHARVTPAGLVADPGGIAVPLPADQDHVSIAYGSGTFLAAWHDWRNTDDYGNGEAWALRISPEGNALGTPIQLSDMTLWQVPVHVAFDGTEFFAAWHASNPSAFRGTEVYGRRVTAEGTLPDEKPVPVSTSYWNEFGPVLAASGDRLLAAWAARRTGNACGDSCVAAQLLERTDASAASARGGSSVNPEPPWSAESVLMPENLYSVHADGDTLFAAGEGLIYRRQDGTWQSTHASGNRMFGIWAGSGVARAVGWCWQIPSFDGNTWQSANCQGGFATPDPAQIGFGVWGPGPDFLMTVGTEGLWQRYDDGNKTAYGVMPQPVALRDTWGTSATNILAVGEMGSIYRYDGTAWTREANVPTFQSLNGVWGSAANDIFAVGDFGTVLHYDGAAWTAQPTPTTAHLLGISGTSRHNVYAVGSRGTILHYDGVKWTQQASGTTQWLFDVAATGWRTWAVGASGTVRTRELAGAGDEDGDGITNDGELAEARNPFIRDNDVFASSRLFAMQQYRDFLGREGDPGGIAFWSGRLDTGQQTRSQVIQSFFDSAEFQGVISPVARLYFAYFLRIPDYGGIDFWIRYFRQGNSLESVSDFFAQSTEFVTTYGALSNGDFVNLVYQNVLGRAPDAEGLAFWTEQLDNAIRTRGGVMLGFSESPEYRQRMAAEVYATMMYIGMLRRAPEQGGFDFWVGYLDNGNSGLALIDGFVAAPEYRNRFLPP